MVSDLIKCLHLLYGNIEANTCDQTWTFIIARPSFIELIRPSAYWLNVRIKPSYLCRFIVWNNIFVRDWHFVGEMSAYMLFVQRIRCRWRYGSNIFSDCSPPLVRSIGVYTFIVVSYNCDGFLCFLGQAHCRQYGHQQYLVIKVDVWVLHKNIKDYSATN